MVTILSLTKMGMYSWLLKYSSGEASPLFRIFLDGVLVAETTQTQYSLAINMDEGSVVEVLDDADAEPMQIFPGRVRLGWFFSEGTEYYRIDEYVSSAWVQRGRMPENGGYMTWLSRFLEDSQTHIFRIVPVGTDGNEGTAKQFAVLMCRRPDVPDAGFAWNAAAQKVIVFDNDSPPDDLINHCAVQWLMNDDAASTDVVDYFGGHDGTAQQNTEDINTAGKIGGALTFNGSSDYIGVDGSMKEHLLSAFSLEFWVKFSALPAAEACIIGNNLDIDNFIEVVCDAQGKIAFYYNSNGNAGGSSSFVTAIEALDTWYHIVCTIAPEGEGARYKIYRNGVIIQTGTTPYCLMSEYNGLADIEFGRGAEAARYFAGALDCIRMFDKELTQAEVNFLYNEGAGRETF